jgi:hypothetical protein
LEIKSQQALKQGSRVDGIIGGCLVSPQTRRQRQKNAPVHNRAVDTRIHFPETHAYHDVHERSISWSPLYRICRLQSVFPAEIYDELNNTFSIKNAVNIVFTRDYCLVTTLALLGTFYTFKHTCS